MYKTISHLSPLPHPPPKQIYHTKKKKKKKGEKRRREPTYTNTQSLCFILKACKGTYKLKEQTVSWLTFKIINWKITVLLNLFLYISLQSKAWIWKWMQVNKDSIICRTQWSLLLWKVAQTMPKLMASKKLKVPLLKVLLRLEICCCL